MSDNIEEFLDVLPGKLICVDKNNYIKKSNLSKDYNELIIFDILDENEIDDFISQLEYSKISKSGCEYISFNEKPFKKWSKNIIKPIFDTLGRFDGYCLYKEDITEKKNLEQKIFETQFVYYEAFESVGIGVWEFDKDIEIFTISNVLKSMLNLDSNVISFEKWKTLIHKDDLDDLINYLLAELEKKSDVLLISNYRIHINKKDFIWINSTGKTTKYDSNGAPSKFLGILQNVTSQIEAKNNLKKYNEELEYKVRERTKELEYAKKEAENSDMAKSEFLSNISHEFFTPLNIILNGVGIISRKLKEDSDINKILKNIKISGENLNQLVKNMLYLAKLDLDSIKFKFYKTDIISLFNSVILEVKNKYDLDIITEVSTPIRYIYCDSMNIKIVLLELIKNSIKYTNEDKIISVKIFNMENCVIFSIKDNGIGIKKDEINSIFERFYIGRNNETTKDRKGLGLSICKEIIKKHNGKIWVEENNDDETGLMINFSLPIVGDKNE
jgi:signal transduction histidine kinase